MKSKYVGGVIVLFLVVVGSLYLFSTIFSPSEMFIRELEYYENLQYDTEEYNLNVFIDRFNEKWSAGINTFEPEIIEVSKQTLREKVAQEGSSGASSNPRFWTIDSDYIPPNLNYDQTRLVLWTIAWENEEKVIYWWRPGGFGLHKIYQSKP
jgi:hypothetical protein